MQTECDFFPIPRLELRDSADPESCSGWAFCSLGQLKEKIPLQGHRWAMIIMNSSALQRGLHSPYSYTFAVLPNHAQGNSKLTKDSWASAQEPVALQMCSIKFKVDTCISPCNRTLHTFAESELIASGLQCLLNDTAKIFGAQGHLALGRNPSFCN